MPGFQVSNLKLAGPQFLPINWNPRGWCEHKCTDTSKGLGVWEETIPTLLNHQTLTPLGSPSLAAPGMLGQLKRCHFCQSQSKPWSHGRDT